MPLPASLANSLELPVVGSPLFIVSGPGPRHRPVQGRHRRLVPRAERPPGGKARRVAEPDRERTRRVQGAASGEEGRTLRGQPDLHTLQRPAR